MKLDRDFAKAVSGAIYGTWEILGSDVISCAEEAGEEVDNAGAIETVLDANYMTTNGYEAQEKLIDAACDEHGYEAVAKFLEANFRLI